jgi:anti-sigma B factor antagonist
MSISDRDAGEVTVLEVEGRLDATTAPSFKNHVKDLSQKGRIRFVADLSAVNFLDSSGLGVLVSALRQVGQQGGDVKIAALRPEMKSLFALTRLNKVFEIHETAQSAIDSYAV